MAAIVLSLPLHLGAWGTMQIGLRYAQRQGWDLAVTLDADGQHEPQDIASLVAPIHRGEAEVVIGACPPYQPVASAGLCFSIRPIGSLAIVGP